jgi:hypothetical protein
MADSLPAHSADLELLYGHETAPAFKRPSAMLIRIMKTSCPL